MTGSTQNDPSEREKWDAEIAFREREIAPQEREQGTRESELQLKEREHHRASWRNPLFMAAPYLGIGPRQLIDIAIKTVQKRL
ncbi:MAG: hypothetical protein AB1Z29_00975 [Desulfobacterales bacterium]